MTTAPVDTVETGESLDQPALEAAPRGSPTGPAAEVEGRLVLDGVDPDAAEAFGAFLRVLRVHRQVIARALAPRGGHPGQAICLGVLAQHDGISQRALADQLYLSAPTVTTMLQRMERAGLVARRADADDQRLTRVRLTDDGRRLEIELRLVLARHVATMLATVTPAERRELARLLGAMADNATQVLA